MQPKRLAEFKCQVSTPDDWAPTVITETGERVVDAKVFLDDRPRDPKRYFVRICFWGGDDLGRDHDFFTNDLAEAQTEYDRWFSFLVKLRCVTLAELKDLGFVNG